MTTKNKYTSSQFKQDYKQAAEGLNNAINQYSGDAGYQHSLEQAQKGAGTIASQSAQGAIDTQNNAMRSNGMGGNAAAIMAGNNAANTYNNAYNNAFAGQQEAAIAAGNNAINAQQQQLTNALTGLNNQRQFGSQIAQTVIGGTGSLLGGIGAIMSGANMSDANTKTEIVKVSKNYNDIMDGVGKILYKKTRKASDLIWHKPEEV